MARSKRQQPEPEQDIDDTERTDTAAFKGRATVELEAGRKAQDHELIGTEGQPEAPDDEGANTDDETPGTEPEPERAPGGMPAPELEPEPVEPEAAELEQR